ncbi:MAG: hypothetical protein OHK0019_00430 [Saprospiraceae bacterium]
MSNRKKGQALVQRDPYRQPQKLRKPQRAEPDGGDGGDTEGVGAIAWMLALCVVCFVIMRLIF